jgi:hypothetical protein
MFYFMKFIVLIDMSGSVYYAFENATKGSGTKAHKSWK